jgi:ribosomal-protein-serine acetyltransferase
MQNWVLGDDARLRLLDEADAGPLYALIDTNRAHLRQWLPWVDHEQSVDTTRAFLRSAAQQFADQRGGQYGIWQQDQLAGVVGQHAIDGANRSGAIGYWLGAVFQGRGLMTRACRALISHAFGDQGLHRVEIRVAPANRRSRAIPERIGFQQEGVLRDAEWLYDHYVDLVVYGMLADEWSAEKEGK